MKKRINIKRFTNWLDHRLIRKELSGPNEGIKQDREIRDELNQAKKLKETLVKALPSELEPPYEDFFNQRILAHISKSEKTTLTHKIASVKNIFLRLASPLVVAAVVLLSFFSGIWLSSLSESAQGLPPIYTPDSEVKVDMFISEEAEATIILLDGLEDLPDDIKISQKTESNKHSSPSSYMLSFL